MKHLRFIIPLLALLWSNAFAQLQLDDGKRYFSQVINPYESVKPGDTIYLATNITLDENWTGYYLNSGKGGKPPKIKWQTKDALKFEELIFPTPKTKPSTLGPSHYYLDEYTLVSRFTVPAGTAPGEYTLIHTEEITVCEVGGNCISGQPTDSEITITVGEETKKNSDWHTIEKTLAKAPVKDPGKFSSTATAEGFELTIDLLTSVNLDSAKDVILITDNKYNSLENQQVTLEKNDDGYRFKFILPNSHEAEESISGILTTKEAKLTSDLPAVHFQAKIEGKLAEAKEDKLNWTAAEKAEHAKLYDPESKILTDAGDPASQSIGTVLLLAFIGGMILNLMPCVFPVLGLKVLGFAQLAGNDPKKIKIHGMVFTLGVLISMWILAGALLALSATTKISWGEQMGNPVFVGFIIILLFVMGLNMYGVFEIGTSLTSAGGNLQNKKGYSGSLFSGILTTLIATPCSGPFLGATMSYALTQPAYVSLLIFTIFALGISFPYIALAFMPALINKLPKPGAWMEVFKKFMAFPLFATAVFFLKAFGGQTGNSGAFWLSMALVLFGLAAWAYGTWSVPYMAKNKRYIWGFGFPLLVFGAAVWMSSVAMNKKSPPHFVEGWQQWHPGLVEHHVSKKRVVWVDYTADW